MATRTHLRPDAGLLSEGDARRSGDDLVKSNPIRFEKVRPDDSHRRDLPLRPLLRRGSNALPDTFCTRRRRRRRRSANQEGVRMSVQ